MKYAIRVKFIFQPTDLHSGFELSSSAQYSSTTEMARDMREIIKNNSVFHTFKIGVENKEKQTTNWFPQEYYVGKLANRSEVNKLNKQYGMGFSDWVKTPDNLTIPCAPNVSVVNRQMKRIYPRKTR